MSKELQEIVTQTVEDVKHGMDDRCWQYGRRTVIGPGAMFQMNEASAF